jgi:hypothetical protein
MKKILLVCGIALFGPAALFAQTATPAAQVSKADRAQMHRKSFSPEQVAKAKTARLDKLVTLNDAQKQKVNAIFLKEAIDNKGRAAQHRQVQDEIKTVLTDDQKARLDEFQKERMERMKQRRMERGNLKPAPGKAAPVTQ